MGGQRILDVLHRDLLLRNHAPRDIVGFRSVVRVRSVPLLCLRIKVALHEPCSWCIVDMVGIAVASKCGAGIKMAAVSAV